MTEADYFRAVLAEQRAAGREAGRMFCKAIVDADPAALVVSAETMDCALDGWASAVRAAARLCDLSVKSRRVFLEFWIHDGDAFRDQAPSDLELADALRACLPRYTGRSKRLFRGESAHNRRNRIYGFSWSGSRRVAESFFRARAPMYLGGTVLLTAEVPASAIIASVSTVGDPYAEREFLVDRRRLRGVRVEVIERLPNPREISNPDAQLPLRQTR